MGDVKSYETPIMALDEFTIGLLEKDRIPGLLIRSDHNGYYNIGVQINDKEVVVVDTTMEDEAIRKIQYWAERVDLIKEQYSREPKLEPYKGQ
ncbi:hypothetical protein SYNTR_1618 [Candidatus Syntrophocurvum alkaliphilum]|uniref:Uncharacterized protein n=1 Tax=Candidatus Syntrophocurvum alkaliphilum TaxID=2293317 RepID=A0A6I6DMA6_9FIRM|nr:hypothetical protein [Candidatus Syntrophocurvum alkaliphilum]QGU00212.1 hypothetical protein SYNTR_1618 [Candidatus Syntrophocurvum alkaliphilum]